MFLLTRIPISILLPFSYVLFPIVYFLIPYRKKLVFKNLGNAFPDWDRKKIRKTAARFYLHFCFSLIESLYTGVLSDKEFRRRYKIKNPELVNDLFDRGKSITLMLGHYANWEWSVSMQTQLRHQLLPIYKPLENPWVDKKVKKDRERFGAETVPLEKILRRLHEYQKLGVPTMTFFLADQRPLMAKVQYWTKFLCQDTPVVMGPEKIAGKFDHTVLFFHVNPVKRGYYEVEFIPVFDKLQKVHKYDIIEKYHGLLEKMIREKPEFWLWTHNRWKHKKEDYYKLRNIDPEG